MNVTRNVVGLLALSQQEELVELPNHYPLSTSEDEGDSDGERKCQKLLEAVNSLGGRNSWKVAERSEASLMVSEFNVTSEGSGEKLVLSDLLESATTLSSLATVKKQLLRVKSKTLEIPLDKKETDQILREAAFSKTSQMLSKWEPIVLQNRQAEQLVFPMEKELPAVAPLEHVFTGWKTRTPLEQEVFNVLHKNKQPVTDPLLTPVEKASLKAMSLEEAKIHRAELQRTRALQSYYEARARREKKIKSKKYHKFIKKGKAKKTLKEFEQLLKDCPSAALQELGKMEEARVRERMSLKHQGSGKWAKSKAIMARYDLEARKAMQEQLAKNRELTQKLQVVPESEEEEEEEEEYTGGGVIPTSDEVKDLQMHAAGLNPWMLRSCSSDAQRGEIKTDPEQLPELVARGSSESEGDERPVAELLLKERSFQQRVEPNSAKPVGGQETETEDSNGPDVSEPRVLFQKLHKENHQSEKQKGNSEGTVLQVQREELAPEESLVFQRLERAHVLEEQGELGKEGPYQKRGLPRPMLKGEWKERNPHSIADSSRRKKKKEQMIDLQNLLTARSPVKSWAVPTVEELEDEVETDHKQIIKEAFAGDDVIREFLKEKREAVEASKPKDLDLTLPGWGEWVGRGLKPSAKKRRHFLVKAPESSPRQDKNLPNVIINEKRNIHAAAHQVQAVPHPFTHHQQFERTIQNPIGYTWNTQRAFQKLTVPKVSTKLGHLIKPLKAENVGYSSSRSDLSVLQSSHKRLSRKQLKQLKKSSAH